MTRNTKIYKVTIENKEICFRTLTVKEISILNNITKPFYKNELAAKFALIEDYDVEYSTLQSIGKEVIDRSLLVIQDADLYQITVENYRKTINNDELIILIIKILQSIPNTSIEYLMNQTIDDLIELACICEALTNKRMFNFQEESAPDIEEQSGHKYFKEDDKSLKDRMKE